MKELLDALLVLVLALNLAALGNSRLLSVIRIVAFQGALLGGIPLLLHTELHLPVILASAAAIILKGIAIPAIMIRSLRAANIKREVEPFIGFLPSIIIGALATVLMLLFADRLTFSGTHTGTLIVPAALATVIVGFIMLITRFKAISQVLGYLVLENGIFIFGMLLVKAVPLVVEMGMLLDLFAGIFVISIITNHINRAFSSIDTRHLISLKE